MSFNRVAVIIPIYNLWKEMTVPCLEALARETEKNAIHLYIIDNASSYITPEEILKFGKSLFDNAFSYVRLEKNFGFAVACNHGAKLAAQNLDPFILLLNNDTIVTKNWLPPLLHAFEDSAIGACGPLLLFPHTNRVQHVGVSQNPLGESEHLYLNFPAKHPLVQKERYLNYITGAAFLIRSKTFFKLGMLCEEYLNGYEDLDICSLLRENGYFLKVVPESIVYHYESQTQGRRDADTQNVQTFTRRNKKLPFDDPIITSEDGYVPSLTKELQYYVALKEEKRRAFTGSMQEGFNPKLCEKLLEKEHLWIDGYHMLATYYEKENRIAEASFLLELAVNFCPKAENYLYLIDFYKKYQQNDAAQKVQNVLNRIFEKSKSQVYQDFVAHRLSTLSFRGPVYAGILQTQFNKP